MCTNCKVESGCGCSGGEYLAVCACEKRVNCPACGHSWGTNEVADARSTIFADVLKPEVLKKMQIPEYFR